MKIKSKLRIDNEDPFKNDLFGRISLANSILSLTKSSKDGFVSCIDMKYGYGKTTFFKMFQKYVEKKNDHNKEVKIICIRYDAWNNDFFEEPLLSIISAFEDSLENIEDCSFEDIKIATKSIAKNIVSYLTKGIIEIDEIKNELNQQKERSVYNDYKSAIRSREKVRESLKDLTNHNSSEFENVKVIFLIDEMDRCRPDYALKLLETVKHFFDIPDFYFILAVDKPQLVNTVRLRYGQNIDAKGYLARFIDFDLSLGPINQAVYLKSKFINEFEEAEELILIFDFFKSYSEKNNKSLRDINKVLIGLKLINNRVSSDLQKSYKSSKENKNGALEFYFLSVIYYYFLVIRYEKPAEFNKIINRKHIGYANNQRVRFLESTNLDGKSQSTEVNTLHDKFLSSLNYELVLKSISDFIRYYRFFDSPGVNYKKTLFSGRLHLDKFFYKDEGNKLRTNIIDTVKNLTSINDYN